MGILRMGWEHSGLPSLALQNSQLQSNKESLELLEAFIPYLTRSQQCLLTHPSGDVPVFIQNECWDQHYLKKAPFLLPLCCAPSPAKSCWFFTELSGFLPKPAAKSITLTFAAAGPPGWPVIPHYSLMKEAICASAHSLDC